LNFAINKRFRQLAKIPELIGISAQISDVWQDTLPEHATKCAWRCNLKQYA